MTARVAKKVMRRWCRRGDGYRRSTWFTAFLKVMRALRRSKKPTPGLRRGRWDFDLPWNPAQPPTPHPIADAEYPF